MRCWRTATGALTRGLKGRPHYGPRGHDKGDGSARGAEGHVRCVDDVPGWAGNDQTGRVC